MAKHRMTVQEHYAVGRIHPRGRVVDDGAENSIRREPAFETRGAFNKPDVQDAEDAHDNSRTARYDNDHRDNWVRAAARMRLQSRATTTTRCGNAPTRATRGIAPATR
jgi:hypothetical protein